MAWVAWAASRGRGQLIACDVSAKATPEKDEGAYEKEHELACDARGMVPYLTIGWTALAAGLVSAAAAATPTMSCSSLGPVSIPGVQTISTIYSAAYGNLPAYCSLVGVIAKRISTQDPYGIVVELNLSGAWSGNFETMGGGGADGSG